MTNKDTEENAPAVLAYRVGQLEKTVATGFREIKSELADLKMHYATKADMQELEARNTMEHKRIDNEVSEIKAWMDWATRIVIGAVLVAVLSLVVGSQVIK